MAVQREQDVFAMELVASVTTEVTDTLEGGELRRYVFKIIQPKIANPKFTVNKKLIKLTESDLHRIVNESVNKILCERYLLESQQSNLGSFIQELDGIFDVKLHNYNSREKGRCLAYITTDTFDKNNNDFKALMNKYQVFISSVDEFDAPEGTIQVNFESKYPKDVTKNVYKNSRVLYHLTRPCYIKQIAKEGIKPIAANEFKRSWYPERIYLLTDRCMTQDIKAYARQLGTSYIIICDIGKMGSEYDFYKDPQSLETFAVFTDKPIPRECIEIKKIKDFLNYGF